MRMKHKMKTGKAPTMRFDELVTVLEAADMLGVSRRRVNKLIETGRLDAEKRGGAWFIPRHMVTTLERRTAGRPPKAS